MTCYLSCSHVEKGKDHEVYPHTTLVPPAKPGFLNPAHALRWELRKHQDVPALSNGPTAELERAQTLTQSLRLSTSQMLIPLANPQWISKSYYP